MEANNNLQQPDLRAYGRVLWRRKWIFLTVVILVPILAYVVSNRSHKVYQSSTLLQVQPTAIDATNAQLGGPTAQFIAIAARLIQTTGVARAAARYMHLTQRVAAGALLHATSVTMDPNTGFITVTARASDPRRAAQIANAFGAAVNTTRARQAVTSLNRTIAVTEAQIQALPGKALSVRNQLTGQLERMRAQREAQGNNAQIIEPATPSSVPVSPHPLRNTMLALIVALLLALALATLAENLDQRIRQPEVLETLSPLPLLCTLPRSAFKGTLNATTIEAFRSLRAKLSFFNVDRDVRSIVIVSGRKGEGKTLVATNLARAHAYAGSDVILVDADLRRPQVASRLGFESYEGLADVLVGKCTVVEAIVDLDVAGPESSRLRVLPAGALPPNPAELLGSQRMHRLIEELSTMCDVVIIDTSPVLTVSDAIPLLDRVSGALLVARVGQTQRKDLQQMDKLFEAATSSALGVVATGKSERGLRPKSPYGYAQTSEVVASMNGAPATQTVGDPPQVVITWPPRAESQP